MTAHKRLTVAVLAILGMAAVGVELYVTKRGIGLNFDALIYIGVAKNLLRGKGLLTSGNQALTQFPPLYPLLLALFGRLTGQVETGARVLAALLWAGNTASVGLLVCLLTRGHAIPAILAALLTLLAPVMFEIHASAMSEPLYLLLSTGMLLALLSYRAGWRRGYLLLAAVLAALALLARYVGFTLLLSAVLWILILPGRSLSARLKDAVLFAAVAGAPIALWMLRGLLAAGAATNRHLVWHPATQQHLLDGLESLGSFAVPGGDRHPAVGVLAIVAWAALAVWTVVRVLKATHEEDNRPWGGLLVALLPLVYVAGVLASISLFDALTPMSTRILSPVFVCMLVLALEAADHVAGTPTRGVRWLAWAPLSALLVGYSLCAGPAYWDAHANGLGMASARYQNSEFVRTLRALPPNTPLLSNNKNQLYLLCGRTAKQFAQKYNPLTLIPDPRYAKLWQRSIATILSEGGLVVFVRPPTPKAYQITLAELQAAARFEVVLSTEEGVILRPLRKADAQATPSPSHLP